MMSKTTTEIGPADHGRRMTLDEFDHAEGRDGHGYELARGVITVVEVPNARHLAQLNAIRRQIHRYDAANPGVIHTIAGGGDCKILIAGLDSERHPDLAIYKTSPPDEDLWSQWVPEIVIEIVSPSSRHRDYEEKPAEYLLFGVTEYWIVDADEARLVVLRRSRGRWSELIVRPPDAHRSRLLPRFEFACGPVFEAADSVGR
jgi:Uma2 family endonuclease